MHKAPNTGEIASIDQLQAYGVTDPQIRIFDDRAYLYASHDASPESDGFVMPDWQIWSSDDLVNWNFETTLSPESTYIKRPHTGCWATDAIEKDGRYFWCFSDVDEKASIHQIGLVVSETPTGPWTDPIGRPWIARDLVDTPVYDPGFLQELNGDTYLIFGVWQYYIVKLSDDLLSLAETPRPIEILDPVGPYGKGKTDDKPFLHRRGNLYYLSWGAYYATAENPYGPYQYRGCIVDPSRMEKHFRDRTWPQGPTQGRHGSFFSWRGQDYFAYCDMSFSGNRYFRGTWVSYVHYLENGAIEPIYIESLAVGRHAINRPVYSPNYSSCSGIRKLPTPDGRCAIALDQAGAWAKFNNIGPNASSCHTVSLWFKACVAHPSRLSLRLSDPQGKRLATIDIPAGTDRLTSPLTLPIAKLSDTVDICMVYEGPSSEPLIVNAFQLNSN